MTERGAAARFAEAMIDIDFDECIIWPFSLSQNGYGWLRKRKLDTLMAHVYICTKAHGPKPDENYKVRHLCGVASCVNPKHLMWGTTAENENDKWEHGTMPYGETHHRAKLTATNVREIRTRLAAGESQTSIAADFDVSPSQVSKIHLKKDWGHLDLEGESE